MTETDENVVFKDGCLRVKILTSEEAETYRNMQNGVNVDATVVRSIAEENGEKRIVEITSDGFSITRVKVDGGANDGASTYNRNGQKTD